MDWSFRYEGPASGLGSTIESAAQSLDEAAALEQLDCLRASIAEERDSVPADAIVLVVARGNDDEDGKRVLFLEMRVL